MTEAGARRGLVFGAGGVLGAAWLPHDGKLIPKELAIALAKGAQNRGVRRDRPEHLGLGAQRLDVVQIHPTRGDRARHIGQYPPPVMHRIEARLGQRRRQPLRKPGAVGQHPQPDHANQADHVVRVRRDAQVLGPSGKLTH